MVDIYRVDVLVNNAGIARSGRVDQQPVREFLDVIATNLTGAFLRCAQAVPRMGNGGSVITISSTVGPFVGLPGRGAYGAAKAGLLGLTRTWAVELAAGHQSQRRLSWLDPLGAAATRNRQRLAAARLDAAPHPRWPARRGP